MVFESLVIDILNKYLGKYVENLDNSQLNIGIWNGDVVLRNLSLRQDALDELQLPIKTICGLLGKLTLKIPWKNLYSEPVEASVEDLYLLIVPSSEVKYDAEMEENRRRENKMAKLATLDSRRLTHEQRTGIEDKPVIKDSFTEKLAAQIIRNVQIYIMNIHFRYEDRLHSPEKPFALGVTLANLVVTTTDQNWEPSISQGMISMIYKILTIEGLSVYLNSKITNSFIQLSQQEIAQAFEEAIPRRYKLVETNTYILGPINIISKLTLNTKPENDKFKIPKVMFNIDLEGLVVKISKAQYHDILIILESIDRMITGAPYRKYRPAVPYKNHYTEWWNFAIKSVLEEVQRKARNWSWQHISSHRKLCREYGQAYKKKLMFSVKSIEYKEIVLFLTECEDTLDIFEIVRIRQTIEMEEQKRLAEEDVLKKEIGWFSGWFSKQSKTQNTDGIGFVSQFEKVMTAAEKEKLYKAIGYHENSSPTSYPNDFIVLHIKFFLSSLEVKVRDEENQVLSGCLLNVQGIFQQKAVETSFKVQVFMEQVVIIGLLQGTTSPELVTSSDFDGDSLSDLALQSDNPLLNIMVEINPLDRSCDQRIHIISRPIKLVYDNLTIAKLIDIFSIPDGFFIFPSLQEAAQTKLTEMKEISLLGFQYAIERRCVMDLKVDLMGFYGILPYKGFYSGKDQSIIVINFGRTMINSKPRVADDVNVQKMHKQGKTQTEIIKAIMENSYDSFIGKLKDVQVQIVLPGESWGFHNFGFRDQYLLHPTNLEIYFAKSLFADDPRLPKLKVSAKVPSINLRFSETRLLALLTLLMSIPFDQFTDNTLYTPHLKASNIKEVSKLTKHKTKTKKFSAGLKGAIFKDFVQFTEAEVKFKLSEVSVCLFRKSEEKDHPFADFNILVVKAQITLKTLELNVAMKLGGLSANLNFKEESKRIINTPMAEGKEEYLLSLDYCKFDKNNPDLHTQHKSVMQKMQIKLSRIDILVHQDAVLNFIQWTTNFLRDLNITTNNSSNRGKPVAPKDDKSFKISSPYKEPYNRFFNIVEEASQKANLFQKSKTTKWDIIAKNKKLFENLIERTSLKVNDHIDISSIVLFNNVDMSVQIYLGKIKLTLQTNSEMVGALDVTGAEACIIVKKMYIQVDSKLYNCELLDLHEGTKYTKMLGILEDGDAITLQLVIYQNLIDYGDFKKPVQDILNTYGKHIMDDKVFFEICDQIVISITATVARTRLIFLNYFILTLLDFLSKFFITKDDIIEAVEAAKDNVQEIYLDSTRIKLNIDIKAPVVIVPSSSVSSNVVAMNLGDLKIHNTLVRKVINCNGHIRLVTYDDINFVLQNLTLTRGKLSIPNMTFDDQCTLIEPFQCFMTIKRNLSTYFYTEGPILEVSGSIDKINVMLSLNDYSTILNIISQNLSETQSANTFSQSSEPTCNHTCDNLTVLVETSQNTAQKPAIPCSIEYLPNKVTKKTGQSLVVPKTSSTSLIQGGEDNPDFKVSFSIGHLTINLFEGVCRHGSTDIKTFRPNKVCVKLSDEHGLAQFTLNSFAMSIILQNDGTVTITLIVEHFILDDTQTSKAKGITRYIKCKKIIVDPEGDTEIRYTVNSPYSQEVPVNKRFMLVITFQKKNDQAMLDIRILNLIFIVNCEHLMKIIDFFSSLSNLSSFSIEPMPPILANPGQSVGSLFTVGQLSYTSQKQRQTNLQPLSITYSFCLKVEDSDIIFLKDMDLDSEGVALTSNVGLKLRISETKQTICGTIKDLQLHTCCLNPEQRKAEILSPVSVTMAGSTPSRHGLNLEINFSQIHLSISPDNLDLLCSVIQTVTESLYVAKDSQTYTFDDEIDHSTLWKSEVYKTYDFWFLKSETINDIGEMANILERQSSGDEFCIVSIPSLIVDVEEGRGYKTLLLESSVQANICDWNSLLSMAITLTMQVSNYNSHLAIWEPLLEPVEVPKLGRNSSYEPWTLNISVETFHPDDMASKNLIEEYSTLKPKLVVNIFSKECMELTFTKTCLKVLHRLSSAFNSNSKSALYLYRTALSPYTLLNHLEFPIILVMEDSSFRIQGRCGIKEFVLESGCEVALHSIYKEDVKSNVGQRVKTTEKYLLLKIKHDKVVIINVPVTRTVKRFFSLGQLEPGQNIYGVVSETEVLRGSTKITLRGTMQVHNHFSMPVNVYILSFKNNEMEFVGKVLPDTHFDVPLNATYTTTNEIFFGIDDHLVCIEPYCWSNLQKSQTLSKLLQFNPMHSNNKEPIFIMVAGEIKQVFDEQNTKLSASYNIHLRSPVILKNFLPLHIMVYQPGSNSKSVLQGEKMQIPFIKPGSSTMAIKICSYLNKEWTSIKNVESKPPEYSFWTFHCFREAEYQPKLVLDLGMYCNDENGSLTFALYSPFWMLNKTGITLYYKHLTRPGHDEDSVQHTSEASAVHCHPHNLKEPILFSFEPNSCFNKKKKTCIKVEKGEWSGKFSLDVPGSSGVITCKCNKMTYLIGVHIQLTFNSLTKLVTFTPYHLIVNQCPVPIQLQELENLSLEPWIKVEPGEVQGFWPSHKLKKLVVRLGDSKSTTIAFPYHQTHSCLLSLKNKYGAVNVSVQVNEGAIFVTFNPYAPGMAPALIINHSQYDIPIGEKGVLESNMVLKSGEKVLFCWSTTNKNHKFKWANKYTYDLRKDDFGFFDLFSDVRLMWVSFLDNRQRVLLFTTDFTSAQYVLQRNIRTIDVEMTVSFHSIGISFVDNIAKKEVLYLSITSSDIVWESRKFGTRRFKTISSKKSAAIGEAYTAYCQKLSSAKNQQVSSIYTVAGDIVLDFAKMEILQPQQQELRCTNNQGLWLQIHKSMSQILIHIKLNRLQIDNQMFDCVFPVIFAPVPSPRSVQVVKTTKPFIECSVVLIINENSNVQQYKYCKILIQEFYIKVDIGFVNALFKLLETSETIELQEPELFAKDCAHIDEPLMAHVTLVSSAGQQTFFEILHLSPLKIHLSFSLRGGGVNSQKLPSVIKVLLQSLGVTLTEIQDVVLKLSFFERNYTFMNKKQLWEEVKMHYQGQLIKQLYVLVLGLDVIGNPFGLVVGISEGVQDLFYEPFMGAIQGPQQFVQGLFFGVRSLFEHTVGGAAGAASRITSAVGKGVAALTFDDSYQHKRQQAMNTRPKTIKQSIAQSGRGLVMGVVEGVGGVFTKPITGARQDGMEGFIKGMGKGVIGLVTRPTAGVIDFASSSFGAVKRAAQLGEEVTRQRIPRLVSSEGVNPYSRKEAEGNRLLKEVENGKYHMIDEYILHTFMGSSKPPNILMLTNNRLMVLSSNDFFGGHQIEFSCTWKEFSTPPILVPNGLMIELQGNKETSLPQTHYTSKMIFIDNEREKDIVAEKIEVLMKAKIVNTI